MTLIISDTKMNTLQLQKILEYYAKDKSFFYGVFPIDKLPSIESYPSCLIMNNQSSKQKGEHWLSIYFNKHGHCEFFDSFGKSPAFYGVLQYLKKYSTRIVYNRSMIQSNVSEYCGLYCVFFLIFKIKGHSMKFYKNLFKKNPISNDLMFSKWIDKYF